MAPSFKNITMSGNAPDGVTVYSANLYHPITLNGSPQALHGSPFWLPAVTMNPGSAITVTPGTTLRVAQGDYITVESGASLTAQGLITQPITITSAATGQLWSQLYVYAGGQLFLSNCDVSHAGYAGNYAVSLASNEVDISRCSIHDNPTTAIYSQGSVPVLTGNQIYSNTTGLTNGSPTTTIVDARNTWWGDASGPKQATTNPNGKGNAVSAGVLYSPWLGPFEWLSPQVNLVHGSQYLEWADLGSGVAGLLVNVSLSGPGGSSQSLGTDLPAHGSLTWDSTTVRNGYYQLIASFHNQAGHVAGAATYGFGVNNVPLHWHGGILQASQTWGPDAVRVVQAEVFVEAGVHLTISPGTIVKFMHGTGITVMDGGILDAGGLSASPVILTSLADDSAGGDTNEDGTFTLPQSGDWSGLIPFGTVTINVNAFTEQRYQSVARIPAPCRPASPGRQPACIRSPATSSCRQASP